MRTASSILHVVALIAQLFCYFAFVMVYIYNNPRAEYAAYTVFILVVVTVILFIVSLVLHYDHPIAAAVLRFIQIQPLYILSGIFLICGHYQATHIRHRAEVKKTIYQERDYYGTLKTVKSNLAMGIITEVEFDEIITRLKKDVALAESSIQSRKKGLETRFQKGVITKEQFEEELRSLDKERQSIIAFRTGKFEEVNPTMGDKVVQRKVNIVESIPQIEAYIEQRGFSNKNYLDSKEFYNKGIFDIEEYGERIVAILESQLSKEEKIEVFHNLGIYSDSDYELEKRILMV